MKNLMNNKMKKIKRLTLEDLERLVAKTAKRVINESVDVGREIRLAQKELVKMGSSLSSLGMRLEGTQYHRQYKRIYDEIVKLNNDLISEIRRSK